jgi:hypothetical protein
MANTEPVEIVRQGANSTFKSRKIGFNMNLFRKNWGLWLAMFFSSAVMAYLGWGRNDSTGSFLLKCFNGTHRHLGDNYGRHVSVHHNHS